MSTTRRSPLSRETSKTRKASAGRTGAAETPLNIRTAGVRVDAATTAAVREKLGLRLGKFAEHVERVTVRFSDVNGPRGGADKECHVQVALSGLPTVVAEERAPDFLRALTAAGHVAERQVRRAVEKADFSQGGSRRSKAAAGAAKRGKRSEVNPPPPGGQFIGKRVGQSSKDLGDVLNTGRRRRTTQADTSLPGVSATDKKYGGGSTARRNALKRAPKATAALEDSATKPSRKSGRKSANRIKSASPMTVTTIVQVRSPSMRAARKGGRRGSGS